LDFTYTVLAQKQEPVARIPVDNCADKDTVAAVPVRDLSTVISSKLDTQKLTRRVVGAPTRLSAPVTKGQALGTLELYYEGKLVGAVPLVAGGDASYDLLFAIWEAVTGFVTSVWFWVILLGGVLLAVGYVMLNIYYNKRIKSRKKKR
jgi:D-alanyl-D-alanine carboxypeptidase (penicillin-binding protein 5/6)